MFEYKKNWSVMSTQEVHKTSLPHRSSDKFEVHSCNKCGMIAVFNSEKKIHVCKTCNNRTDFNKVQLPYACKLLFQELITMNIAPRIKCN